jgi:hypothetical protein
VAVFLLMNWSDLTQDCLVAESKKVDMGESVAIMDLKNLPILKLLTLINEFNNHYVFSNINYYNLANIYLFIT